MGSEVPYVASEIRLTSTPEEVQENAEDAKRWFAALAVLFVGAVTAANKSAGVAAAATTKYVFATTLCADAGNGKRGREPCKLGANRVGRTQQPCAQVEPVENSG